jgi:hypothetical protein
MNISRIIIFALITVCILNSCRNNKAVKVQTSIDKGQAYDTSKLVDKSVCEEVSRDTSKWKYELVEDWGIMVEKFDPKIKDENRYNQNNIIYTPKTIIKYSYKYIDNNAKEYLFKICDLDRDGFGDLIDVDKADNKTIKSVLITVLEGGFRKNVYPDYNQTVIKYDYLMNDGNSCMICRTGLVENEANIWMHPPREMNFKILELNPFPYIKKPYTIGNKWFWKLGIGDQWSNKNWKEWKGSIENMCEYEIIDKVNIKTNLGKLECYKIKSIATSRIGKTSLMAYFNEKYGFVKLDYTNIDNTKIVFEIMDYGKYESLLDCGRYNL